MATSRQYAEELRAIGQALQTRGVSAFELHCVKAGYFVKDLREPQPSVRNWLRRRLTTSTESRTYGFEPSDVEELSKAGRARRSVEGQLTNFRDLSNVLRTVGTYIDSKQVDLIELEKTPITISLVYRDKWGNEEREDRPMSSFYNLFREIFMTRSATEPT